MGALNRHHGGPAMRHRHAISDDDWARIKDLLPGQPGQHGKVAKDNRTFVDAVLWVARTGAPWRDLPERFGNWNSTWRRGRRRGISPRFVQRSQASLPSFTCSAISSKSLVDRASRSSRDTTTTSPARSWSSLRTSYRPGPAAELALNSRPFLVIIYVGG